MSRPRLVEEHDLLDLMLVAFADLGFDGTSMRSLCRHLGVNHNLIYQRYQSKEAAWTAAVDHGFHELEERLFVPRPDFDDLCEGLRTVLRRWVDATIERPALARIIHQESARSGPRFDYMRDTYILPIQERARTLLRHGQDEGFFRPGAITAAYFFLSTWGLGGIAASQGLADLVGHGDDPREAAYVAIDVVVSGLKA